MTTATTSRIAAPIANIYRTNESFFANALDGLDETKLWYRPTTANNPMLWIAGHIVQTRAFVLKIMGDSFDTAWGGLFDRGAKLEDPAHYPSMAEISRTMESVTGKMHDKLQSLDDEALLSPAQGPKFPNSETLADQVAFLALHESYHVGQMGYLRKALGHAGPLG